MRGEALTREISDAGVGVSRLVAYDPRWTEGFDPSTTGFLRSFLGPLLSLPFALVTAQMYATAAGVDVDRGSLMWAAGVSHLVNVLAYPLVVGLLARPMGYGAGYAGFITVTNWASFFLNLALAGTSVLTLLGETGFGLYQTIALAILGLSLFITWRTARETLCSEVPPALLMVVLAVAVLALSDQVGGWLAPDSVAAAAG